MGEFVGRKTSFGWNTLKKREQQGQYQNIDWVAQHLKGSRNPMGEREGSVVDEFLLPEEEIEGNHHSNTSLVDSIPGCELVVELIPEEWGLGTGKAPEKWVFTVLDKKVVIEALKGCE